MFDFLRKKPKLCDLIPKGFVDIHSHIIPGLDDGSKSINQSISLIKGMNELGFKKIIGTPHSISGLWDNSPEDIKKSYDKLMKSKDISTTEISYASEYMIDQAFLEKIQSQPLLCLIKNYVLVELSYLQPPINLYEILFELQIKGYVPVLAHPERYIYFSQDLKNMEKLRKAGCLFQLNLMSAVGHYGRHIASYAEKLLKAGLIDFTASDIHNEGHLKVFRKQLEIKSYNLLERVINSNKFFD